MNSVGPNDKDGSRTPQPEKLLDLLWRQAADHAFILMDPEGIIVGWRGAAEAIFWYDEEEVLGQRLDFTFTENDRLLGLPKLELTVANASGASEDERWHVRKDGALLWLSGSTTTLMDSDVHVGFAKIVTDRTNTRAQIETLANRAEAAKRDLAARDVFFGRLTHEVRNSLGPIQSVAALIEGSVEADRFKLPIAIVRRQVQQMERMMRDLEQVARAGVGKLQLIKAELDLGREVTEVAEALRDRAAKKKQALTLLMPSAPVRVCADQQRLHQIVFNLIHNAVKYTPEGGSIWVHCTVEADYGVIKVEDTGIGISAEILPVIFDLFTQETPGGADGGFGVGLSLVKDLVDAHNGIVEVACDGKGKGSKFIVRLPLSAGELADVRPG